jgi:hypothetical protein
MYRSAVIAVSLLVPVVIVTDLLFRLRHRNREPKQAVAQGPSRLLRWLRVAVNIAGLLSLEAIALTGGFSALLNKDHKMTGDRLIWHVACAPAFALAAVAVTLFWAHRNRLESADWSRMTPDSWAVPLRKFFFWSAAVLAVPTMVSILLAMLPLAGTDDQETLFLVHRCCAPLLAACGTLFAYFALVTWRERSAD